MKLKGKVAIITGSSNGIGESVARLFSQSGAQVIIADINYEKAQTVADSINAQLYETIDPAIPIQVDVSDRDSVNAMVEQVIWHCGKIDILVNNAGIVKDNLLHKIKEEDFDKVVAVNLKGVFNCAQAVLPYMMEQNSGCILNASSVVAMYGGSIGQSVYTATKAAVIGFTHVWSKELAKYQIRVNAVSPGYTQTNMMSSVPQKVLDMLIEKTPLKRLGEPSDIAEAYLYLATAPFVTGEVLNVNGGLTL